jgi:LPXTG-motif cell wall-anchored protein
MALGLFSKVSGGGMSGDTNTSSARAGSTLGDMRLSGDRVVSFGDTTTGAAATNKTAWIIGGLIALALVLSALVRRKRKK